MLKRGPGVCVFAHPPHAQTQVAHSPPGGGLSGQCEVAAGRMRVSIVELRKRHAASTRPGVDQRWLLWERQDAVCASCCRKNVLATNRLCSEHSGRQCLPFSLASPGRRGRGLLWLRGVWGGVTLVALLHALALVALRLPPFSGGWRGGGEGRC